MSGESFESYVQGLPAGVPVEVRRDLAPVIARIAAYLPPDIIASFYTSAPAQTGGQIKFPFCRVDSTVFHSRDQIKLLQGKEGSDIAHDPHYTEAARLALKAIMWVDVGFQGVKQLHHNSASSNWAGSLARKEDDYNSSLKVFAKYRKDHAISDDIFTQFHAEGLLSKFLK